MTCERFYVGLYETGASSEERFAQSASYLYHEELDQVNFAGTVMFRFVDEFWAHQVTREFWHDVTRRW